MVRLEVCLERRVTSASQPWSGAPGIRVSGEGGTGGILLTSIDGYSARERSSIVQGGEALLALSQAAKNACHWICIQGLTEAG